MKACLVPGREKGRHLSVTTDHGFFVQRSNGLQKKRRRFSVNPIYIYIYIPGIQYNIDREIGVFSLVVSYFSHALPSLRAFKRIPQAGNIYMPCFDRGFKRKKRLKERTRMYLRR